MTLVRPTILLVRIGILLASGLSSLALAAPASAPAQPEPSLSMGGEVLGIVLPVALIIVALFAVLYFVRRRFGLSGQDAPLTILQILPVGSRERIVVVKSRSGRLFVVGVGAQTVTLITNLERSDIEAPAVPDILPAADDSHTVAPR
jgi:flagellar biogenesis protein FliO